MLVSKKNQEIQFLTDLDQSKMLFFLLVYVKMPTIVGILTFMRRKISCSAELSRNMFFFITSGLDRSIESLFITLLQGKPTASHDVEI